MYLWRKLTTEQREEALRQRKGRHLPWHSPPHIDFEGSVTFLVSSACYEHAFIVGKSSKRLAEFEEEVIEACTGVDANASAWCILPNHYHLLLRVSEIRLLRQEIGKVHGRTSFRWNREDDQPGRKVWFNFFDRDMRSDGIFGHR
ncbi:MAG: transposase [Blastocatellia bacterium]